MKVHRGLNELFDINSHKIVNFSRILKFLSVPEVSRLRCFAPAFFLILISQMAFGQAERKMNLPKGDLPVSNRDSLRQIEPKPDTVKTKPDSIQHRKDSIAARNRRSDIVTTIKYSARDSIRSSVDRKIVRLYGDAKIKYGEVELMAESIVIDYEHSTISASGKLDSLGRRVGYPVFVNGPEKYETKSIVYNFKTKKALISEVVTKQQEDAILHGNKVFKNEKNELLSIHNAYTTCNLPHPHYSIIATKAKAIPGDKIIVGPFYMELNNVPLPLGFAFGIFPSPKKSASGVIVPLYGEERNRGFFLRNGGYFFDISDYFKLQVTGDIYSKGSSGLHVASNYRKRYHHSGNLNFNFTNNITTSGDVTSTVKDFQISWSHTPQTRGTGRFSASVNAATASYNTSNFLGVNTNPEVPRLDNTTRKLNSNVSYSKSFGTLYNLALNFRLNQDLTTKQVDIPLPDMSFNVNNIYPFKNSGKGLLLENINFRYSMAATNQITNNLGKIKKGGDITQDSIAPFNFQTLPALIANAKKGIRNTIPVSTSFKILNFFTVSPSINIDNIMYFEKLVWGTSASGTTAVVKDTIREFNQVFNYSGGVSLTTRIYGTYFFKNKTGIQAIRHIINPTISYNYQPNFGNPSYGYYQALTLVNNPNVVYKSVHEGFVYGSSRFGESQSMNFGVNNTIEMKVKSRKDTVARKVPLFNSLGINSSYNFKADSFKLAPFAISANTNILGDKLNVNLSGTLDPYKYVTIQNNEGTAAAKEIRTSAYSWGTYTAPANYHIISASSGIGRITNANFALSTNLSPKGRKKDSDTREKISKSNASDTDKQYLLQNPDSYIDFNIPWNLRLSYNADYSRPVNTSAVITQAMRFSGDFNLTEKWKIVLNSGYDFQQGELTQTYITISRDLHCWLINLSWVPFGKYTSYNFYIGIKSSLLKDLKLNRTRSFFDN